MFYFDVLLSSTLSRTNTVVVTYTDMNITTTINITTVKHSPQHTGASKLGFYHCKIMVMTPSTNKDITTVTLETTNIFIRRKSYRAGRTGRDTTVTTLTTLERSLVRLLELMDI